MIVIGEVCGPDGIWTKPWGKTFLGLVSGHLNTFTDPEVQVFMCGNQTEAVDSDYV